LTSWGSLQQLPGPVASFRGGKTEERREEGMIGKEGDREGKVKSRQLP